MSRRRGEPEPEAEETLTDAVGVAASLWSAEEGGSGAGTANDEQELATIRVRTMFGLVEEPVVREERARVLYMTNMQAKLFEAATVPKMLAAFELDSAAPPALVINLMFASAFQCGVDDVVNKPEHSEQEKQDYYSFAPQNVLGNAESFTSREEATQATRRLTSFFKEVLLPLAAETNAIILTSGQTSDLPSVALAEVLPAFGAKYGGKLPFTIFATAPACNLVHSSLYDPASYACELANKSKNWRKGVPKAVHVLQHHGIWGYKDPKKLERTDLVPGLGNYIVVEGISGKTPDRWKQDSGPYAAFTNELLQALSRQLPALCLRVGASNTSQPLSQQVQLANRDVPVLMLDLEARPSLGVTVNRTQPSTRDDLIAKAIEVNLARHQELWKLGRIQGYDQHYLAFFFDVLNGDGDSSTTVRLGSGASDEQSLFESLRDAEAAAATAGGGQPFTEAQLERVLNHLIEMMAQTHLRAIPAAEREELAPGFDPTAPELQQVEGFDPKEHWAERLRSIWSVYEDLFKSERVYGANLENLTAVKGLIDQIVKRDRLPPKNSLEAQQLLRDAWNAVDIYAINALKYKRLAKASYVVQLLLGIVVIVFTIFRSSIDQYACEQPVVSCHAEQNCRPPVSCHGVYSSSTGIFFASSLLTLVTGVTVFFQPSQRWRELRAMTERVQSDVFQFRTRTGVFAVSVAESRRPELQLMSKIQNARSTVIQLGGLTESSFTRQYPVSVYRHGQNKAASSQSFDLTKLSDDAPIDIENRAVTDNHHSPMKPSQYISARLIPMLHYYRTRVPKKYREQKTTVFLILLATSSIAVLSYLNGRTSGELSAVAGVVAGTATALTSWGEYNGADRKMNRFTNAIVALENHLIWWNSLPAVEQTSLSNINRLVSEGEEIKMAEVNAWADVSRAREEKSETATLSENGGDTKISDNPMFLG